jgi:large subunit ribosomal protein L18
MANTKQENRRKIRYRIRKKVAGTASRPRCAVYKSNKAIYLQLIDDVAGHTLAAADSRTFNGKSIAHAEKTAAALAEKAKKKKITQIVFDRSGYPYHGKVKSISSLLRVQGLTH